MTQYATPRGVIRPVIRPAVRPVTGVGGLDPDAAAFFDNVETAGGVLTTEEKTAINSAANVFAQSTAYAKTRELWVPMSDVLGGALVKFLFPLGASSSFPQGNLAAGDYTRTGGFFTNAGAGKFLASDFAPSSATPPLTAGEQGMGIYSLSQSWSGVLGGTDGSGANTNYVLFSNSNSVWQGQTLNHGQARAFKWHQQSGGDYLCGHNGIEYRSAADTAETPGGTVTLLGAAGGLNTDAKIGGYAYFDAMTEDELADLARFIEALNVASGRVIRQPGTISFAGDSITTGFGVAANERWSSVSSASLSLTEINRATSGCSMSSATNPTNYVANANVGYPRRASNDFSEWTAITFGTNDLNSAATAQAFEDDYRTVLTAFSNRGNYDMTKIILCSAPWSRSASSNFSAARQSQFASIVGNLALEFGCRFCDFSNGRLKGTNDFLPSDDIHPNAAGHALLAQDFEDAMP